MLPSHLTGQETNKLAALPKNFQIKGYKYATGWKPETTRQFSVSKGMSQREGRCVQGETHSWTAYLMAAVDSF